MSKQSAVLHTQTDRISTITINRPKALNAMNQDVFCGITDALSAASAAKDTAVVILTGAGRAFSAGQDLDEMTAIIEGTIDGQAFPQMLKVLTEFEKPLIAAVNGLGVGIGMTALAHCDLVLMADDAKLRTPFPQLGLAPEAGSSDTFIDRFGWQDAAYALLSGRWFSAQECLQMGLAWRLCAPGELMLEAQRIAAEIAQNPIPSLVATKKLMLASGRPQNALAAHKREVAVYAELMGAAANREAITAFKEKRNPDFSKIEGL